MVDEPIPMDVSGHQTLADMYGVPYNESKNHIPIVWWSAIGISSYSVVL